MNANQKETFYSNFDYFIKKFNLKKSDIEKEAGFSQGYLSRFLKSEDSNNFPAVSFLEFCSRKFGVTMDALINTRFGAMNETEKAVEKFISKLVEKTKKDKILWNIYSYKDIVNNVNQSGNSEWEGFYLQKEPSNSADNTENNTYSLRYSYAGNFIGSNRVSGDMYISEIYDGLQVFLIPFSGFNHKTNMGMTIWTLWMERVGYCNPYRLECIAWGDEDVFTALLPSILRLKDTIIDRQTHVQVTPLFKNIINWFVDGEPEDSNPFNYGTQELDQDNLPF